MTPFRPLASASIQPLASTPVLPLASSSVEYMTIIRPDVVAAADVGEPIASISSSTSASARRINPTCYVSNPQYYSFSREERRKLKDSRRVLKRATTQRRINTRATTQRRTNTRATTQQTKTRRATTPFLLYGMSSTKNFPPTSTNFPTTTSKFATPDSDISIPYSYIPASFDEYIVWLI